VIVTALLVASVKISYAMLYLYFLMTRAAMLHANLMHESEDCSILTNSS